MRKEKDRAERHDFYFIHDFGYYFPLFSSLLKKKREEENEKQIAKIVIKSHAFLLDQRERLDKSMEGKIVQY